MSATTAERRGRMARQPILLPDGDWLKPRAAFGKEELKGLSDRTVRRMNLPGRLIGGVAHVQVKAALAVIAQGVSRSNQPPPVRRRRRGQAKEAAHDK